MIAYAKRVLAGLLRHSALHRKAWDKSYASGKLNRYAGLEQFARYSVIEGYCRFYKPQGGRILDIGCGPGILGERFNQTWLTEYVGVDISAVAVQQAVLRYPRGEFIAGDARSVDLGPRQFDFIIFNEAIYSFADYQNVIKKLQQEHLAEGGYFVFSITAQEHAFREAFEAVFASRTVSCTDVADKVSGKSWRIYAIQG